VSVINAESVVAVMITTATELNVKTAGNAIKPHVADLVSVPSALKTIVMDLYVRDVGSV